MRCRLKCHNERNPYRRLPSGYAGDSGGTAAARREEGGDDVKSARPLRPGPHTCYNGGHRKLDAGDGVRILKSPPSSDWSLQPDSTKLDSLVIAHQPWRGEYVPGPCTGWNTSFLETAGFPFLSINKREVRRDVVSQDKEAKSIGH